MRSWDIGDRWSIVSEVDQAGMVGGGVETTGGRDQFPGHIHAYEHFTSCYIVVAGGLEDVRDALGSGTVLQEAEDGLPMRGAQGTSAETCQVEVILFTEPVDGGDT